MLLYIRFFEFDDASLGCVGASVFGKIFTKSQTNDDIIASITWYLSKPNVVLFLLLFMYVNVL